MNRYVIRYFITGIVLATLFSAMGVAASSDMSGAVSPSGTGAVAPPVTPSPSVASTDEAEGEMMTDIIDIKQPEAIGFDKRIIYYILYCVLALIAIGLLIVLVDYFFRRRKRTFVEEVIIISPEEEARKKLLDLKASDITDPREYYFILTAILRGYMGRRFDIDALEMTTEELVPVINALAIETSLKTDIKGFLKSTDPVKFAGLDADPSMMETHFGFVETVVGKTTPVDDSNSKENHQ